MKLQDRMLVSIKRRVSPVILRKELAGMGSASQVSEALKEMQRRGALVRLGLGVYAKASKNPTTGTVSLAGDPEAVAAEVFEKLGLEAKIMNAQLLNAAGGPAGDIAVFIRGRRRINRRLSLGGQSLSYIKDRSLDSRTQTNAVVPGGGAESALKIPSEGVGEFVARLAKRHRVKYVRTVGDEWAETVTRLSGDEVRSDATEDLLVELKRSRKLTDREMAALLVSHLREKTRVRSL